MTIDTFQDYVLLGLDKPTKTVFLSADEGQKTVDALRLMVNEAKQNIHRAKPITEIWNIQVGLTNTGIAIQFNQLASKVRVPWQVALKLADVIENTVNNYKRGYTLKFIHKINKR